MTDAEKDARIATLEAEVAEAKRAADCPMLFCPYEQRAQAAEATIAAVRAYAADLRQEAAQDQRVSFAADRLDQILGAPVVSPPASPR